MADTAETGALHNIAKEYEKEHPDVIQDKDIAETMAVTINDLKNTLDDYQKKALKAVAEKNDGYLESYLKSLDRTKKELDKYMADIDKAQEQIKRIMSGSNIPAEEDSV